MTKNHKGIFFLIFSGLVAALLLAGCPDPNKNGDSPAVAGPTRTDIAFSDDKLEITFDKELKAFDAKKITVILDNSVIPATAYTLSVSGTKLVMTFKTNPIAGQKYKVTLKAGAVTGKDGGTSKKEDSAEIPFRVPPAFQSMAFSSEKKLELTFNQTLDKASTSHPDPSKVTITRAGEKLSATDYSLSINSAKLVITFNVNATLNQKYTVALGEGAVKGNKLSSLAVSPAKEITFGVTPPPAYTGIAQNNNKIELSFNKNLATTDKVNPNPTHITVTRTRGEGASETLTIGTDYSLSIDGQTKLVITIKSPTEGEYTVALAKGAVKSVDGKFSEAVSPNPSIPMYNLPAIVGAPVFETSNTKLVVTFNTALASISAGGITVESKANEEENDNAYANVSGAMAALNNTDKTKVIITLPNPATEPKVYRVVVAIGGVTATLGGVSNVAKLESAGVAYSAKPALDASTSPYIVGKTLVATFNMNIALVPGNKVEVYKGSAKPGTKVDGTTASVNTTDKTLLEVTLPAGDTSATGDVYRLKLLKDAVSKEGDTKNKNAEFTSPDITILAAPVLDTTQDPYMVGGKIYVTFDKAIEYVDMAKVKVKKAGTSGGLTGADAKITTNPVVYPTNDKQLVITVNEDPPQNNNFYRVHLEAGAIGGRNTALTAEITPTDKDIQVAPSPALTANTQPVFSSTTELSVSFRAAVAFVDTKAIKVQSSPDGTTFTDVITANRTIAIDGTDPKKVNITLKNGTEATPYTQTWKVIFPVGSVRDAKRNGNNTEQATAEIKLQLSDIYSWKKVLANGAPGSGNRWTARHSHTSVVFPATGSGSRIWVMGGWDGRKRLNDVWSSADGENWTNESKKLLDIPDPDDENKKKYADMPAAVVADALWSARNNHTSVVFKDKIWVMGGFDPSNDEISNVYLNDVWSSTDGITWAKSPTPITPATQLWSVRQDHASVVFDSKIWIMGGYDEDGNELNDVWSSADGINWNEAEKTAQGKRWPRRFGHEAVVANGKIWVMGGAYEDVWYSTDGADWTQAQNLSTGIGDHSSALFKSRIWLLGGRGDSKYYNHVFSLKEDADNSTAWVTEKNADWLARRNHTSVVFKDKIWVLGGRTISNIYFNDVWNFGVQN